MQSLDLAPQLWADLVSGEKRATIRWGERTISPGPMAYVHETERDRRIEVMVTRVTEMPLREVAEFLGRKRDWPDRVLLEGMRKHYPEITLEDRVQVIEHPPFERPRPRR
ncbi:MAG: ASCH domain-containing protein [Pseudomonadota bacterium]